MRFTTRHWQELAEHPDLAVLRAPLCCQDVVLQHKADADEEGDPEAHQRVAGVQGVVDECDRLRLRQLAGDAWFIESNMNGFQKASGFAMAGRCG